MQWCVLVRRAAGVVGIVVIKYVKIATALRPYVVGFGRMNMRIVSAGASQHVVIIGGVGHLPANMAQTATHDGISAPVHQTIDEWRMGILKDLLDGTAELVCRLGPVVVFHRDDEDCPDFSPFVLFGAAFL